jgi:hypothetical protein
MMMMKMMMVTITSIPEIIALPSVSYDSIYRCIKITSFLSTISQSINAHFIVTGGDRSLSLHSHFRDSLRALSDMTNNKAVAEFIHWIPHHLPVINASIDLLVLEVLHIYVNHHTLPPSSS